MSNSEYREAQQQAREHGLRARQEARLENATYTAAEVKVLTEAALRLGRKEAGEEIAVRLEAIRDQIGDGEQRELAHDMATIARYIASQPAPAASSARTDLSVDTDLPQDSQTARGAL